MPNPYVTSVDRDAFWNQYRSTPEPALMMERPPRLETPALYRDRWPSSGPYAGQSFPPFAYGEQGEPTPIQMPLPEGQFPNPPSDMPINGLGVFEAEVSRFGVLPMLAAAFAGYHGYKWGGAKGAAMWGGGSLAVTTFVSPMLWPVVPAVAFVHGSPEGRFKSTSLFGISGTAQDHFDAGLEMANRVANAETVQDAFFFAGAAKSNITWVLMDEDSTPQQKMVASKVSATISAMLKTWDKLLMEETGGGPVNGLRGRKTKRSR